MWRGRPATAYIASLTDRRFNLLMYTLSHFNIQWVCPRKLQPYVCVCVMIKYPPANFGDTIRLFVFDLRAGRGRASTACQWAGRDVIAIDRWASSSCCYLDGGNWQIAVFRRQNSRFRKRFSKIRLSYNVAVPR